MRSKQRKLLPKDRRILDELGENIKLARLRRNLTAEQVAERAHIGRSTLWRIENGSERIGIGMYLQVLSVLGLGSDLKKVGKDDVLGRKLQDAKLVSKKRASNKGRSSK